MTPTLLIPALLCTAEIYAPQIPALWPYGPVTVASTLDGDTLPKIAAAILADAPPKFALAGISMGGYIAFEILRQAPERVLKLALLDTSARPDTPDQTAQRLALLAQARATDYVPFLTDAIMTTVHPARQSDPTLRAIYQRMVETIDLTQFTRQTEATITRPDSRPTLPTITVPTLVLVGDSDTLTPPDLAQEIADNIPNSHLTIIPNCGHSSTLEQPEAVNQALIKWLAK